MAGHELGREEGAPVEVAKVVGAGDPGVLQRRQQGELSVGPLQVLGLAGGFMKDLERDLPAQVKVPDQEDAPQGSRPQLTQVLIAGPELDGFLLRGVLGKPSFYLVQ